MGGFGPARPTLPLSEQEVPDLGQPRPPSLFDLITSGLRKGYSFATDVNQDIMRREGITPPPSAVRPASPPPAAPTPPDLGPDRSNLGPVAPFATQMQESIRTGLGFPKPSTGPTDGVPHPPPKPAMRAIKMPNGTFLFTNRDEIGGQEVVGGPAAAGREIRAMDRLADPTHTALLNVIRSSRGATSDMPGAITSASVDRSRQRGEGDFIAPTRKVAGATPDISGGAYSLIEGTPQQQAEIKLEDMISAIALERAKQELALTQLGPEEAAAAATQAAMANNPTIQTGEWMLRVMGPQLDEIEAQKQDALSKIDPRLDEKTRRQEELRIAAKFDADRKNLTDIMGTISRQAVTP